MDGFELVCKVYTNKLVPLSKYKSIRTGLIVYIGQVEGPLVNGYFCLATEAYDDDGLPHTLEHLVFLGSEAYPFKGVLDLIANRCLASGTNAWTDTDHTCYTLTTAGCDGFLNILPVYMDHVLYPTLTDSGYVTEVHHINGEGENAGVVYCEMQARENSGESRVFRELQREMYPGRCAYKSETGGMLLNLRESTSHEKVRNYHHTFYRPENLCMVVTGQVNHEEVFAAIRPFEDKILEKGERGGFDKPWQSSVPPLEQTVDRVVQFGSDEETHGMVFIGWRGPKAKSQYELLCMMIVMEYLTDTVAAPLQRHFVEMEDPYCSKVSYSIIENSMSCIHINFMNVIKGKLGLIRERLESLLKRIASGVEPLNMKRLDTQIHRKILESLNSMEDEPHDTLAFNCIGDFLFGESQEELDTRVNPVTAYRHMKSERIDFWVNLMNKYFIDRPHIVIVGEPSTKLMEEMGADEKDRLKKQQDSLGEAGMKEKAEQLEQATDDNEKEPPDDMLLKFAVPNASHINFHPIQRSNNITKDEANKNTEFPLSDIPFRFQLDDIHSNFIQLTAMMDSTAVTERLRPYLPLFCEIIFESPILRNGEFIPHEDVVSELAEDTLYSGGCLGVGGQAFGCGDFSQLVVASLKVEQDKYKAGIQWLKELIYQTQFTKERLKIVSTKLANEIVSMKRKGGSVVRTLLAGILYKKESNLYISSMLRQQKFLTGLIENLDANPEQVIKDMEALRTTLITTGNMRIHMAADIKQITSLHTDPVSPWVQFLPSSATVSVTEMKKPHEYIQAIADVKDPLVIVGVGSVESSYLLQAVPCISSYNHPDVPAISVFIQYLTQCEGPIWRQVRGLGLAYHYSMYFRCDTGQLYLLLSQSSNLTQAYKECKEIILSYISGEEEFSEMELESARSSLIFEIIDEEKTVSDVSVESMLSYLREISHNYNKELLEKVSKVTIDDLQQVGKYFTAIYDSDVQRVAVCCHPSKVDETKSEFKELGLTLTVITSLEEDFLVSL